MLSRKEKQFLDKGYPLVTPFAVIKLLPALSIVVFIAFSILYGHGELIRYTWAVVLSAVIFSTSLASFLVDLICRHDVRKNVISVTHGLAFRINRGEFEDNTYRGGFDFAREIVVYDIVGMAIKTLSSFATISKKERTPIIFITIHNYRDALIVSKKTPLVGMKRHQWRQIEWTGYRSRARKRTLHEVAHGVLCSSKAKYDEEKQHNIIRASGVEYVLEVVQK